MIYVYIYIYIKLKYGIRIPTSMAYSSMFQCKVKPPSTIPIVIGRGSLFYMGKIYLHEALVLKYVDMGSEYVKPFEFNYDWKL